MHGVSIWDAVHIEDSAGLIKVDTGYDTWGLVPSATESNAAMREQTLVLVKTWLGGAVRVNS